MYADTSASERRFLPPAVAVSVIAFALRPPAGAAVDSSHVAGNAASAAESTLWLPLVRRTREPFRGLWALPGGPTRWDETLTDTALRTSRWAVRRDPSYLEQLYSFGGVERSADAQRLVTIAYWALYAEDARSDEPIVSASGSSTSSSSVFGLPRSASGTIAATDGADRSPGDPGARARWDDPVPSALEDRAGEFSEAVWFSADSLPELAFDHARIVETAIERLRSRTEYAAIAHHFLGAEFTLARLRSVHEAVRGRSVDPANFRRQTLARGLVVETGSLESGATGRPAKLYRFREDPDQGGLGTLDPSLSRSTP